jgi:hypothetical protein
MAKTDEASRRLHPRLRCLRNGAAQVNLLRSDISATVASAPSLAAESVGVPVNLDLALVRETLSMSPSDTPPRTLPKPARRLKLAAQPAAENSFVNVFVEVFRDKGGVDGAESATLTRIRGFAQQASRADAARRESPCNADPGAIVRWPVEKSGLGS